METVIQKFCEAASRGDEQAMHRLVDWPVSAAPVLARSLIQLPFKAREEVARAAIADHARDAQQPLAANLRAMRELAGALGPAPHVRLARDDEKRWAQRRYRFEWPTKGLSTASLGHLRQWQSRTRDITEPQAMEGKGEFVVLLATTFAPARVVLMLEL